MISLGVADTSTVVKFSSALTTLVIDAVVKDNELVDDEPTVDKVLSATFCVPAELITLSHWMPYLNSLVSETSTKRALISICLRASYAYLVRKSWMRLSAWPLPLTEISPDSANTSTVVLGPACFSTNDLKPDGALAYCP